MRENRVIEMFRKSFPESGIGDDAAILSPPSGDMLLSTDAVVENVHYRLGISTLSQVLQKAVTSNVSDIYAMGGVPSVILLAAGIPGGYGEREIEAIIEGTRKACDYYEVILGGGDTVSAPGAGFFSLTVLGEACDDRIFTRSGARPGDGVYVTGACGASLAGMLLLETLRERSGEGLAEILLPEDRAERESLAGISPEIDIFTGEPRLEEIAAREGLSRRAAECLEAIRAFLVPVSYPLDTAALAGAGHEVTAMIDVSDGLGRDLSRLCEESGVGAVVEEQRVPLPAVLAGTDRIGPNDLVKTVFDSGEEYVKIVTLDSELAEADPEGLVRIGEVTGEAGRVLLRRRDGTDADISGLGYEHVF